MGLTVKISRGIEYLYFQAGKESIYIGPSHDLSKSKPENVLRAIEYSKKRAEHYMGSVDELLALLPPEQRRDCMAKYGAEMKDRIKKYKS